MRISTSKPLFQTYRATPVLARCTPVLKIKPTEQHVGKTVEHEGDVYVFGDVDEGTSIQATGDVAVWGNVHGHVHAGWPSTDSAAVHAFGVGSTGSVCIGGCQQPPRLATLNGSTPPTQRSKRIKAASINCATATGFYAIVLGMVVSLFPESIYGILFDTTLLEKGLIRLGGTFLTAVGLQYFVTALGDFNLPKLSFYHATIISRLFLITAIISLVVARSIQLNWLYFAGLNAIGALAMLKTFFYKPS